MNVIRFLDNKMTGRPIPRSLPTERGAKAARGDPVPNSPGSAVEQARSNVPTEVVMSPASPASPIDAVCKRCNLKIYPSSEGPVDNSQCCQYCGDFFHSSCLSAHQYFKTAMCEQNPSHPAFVGDATRTTTEEDEIDFTNDGVQAPEETDYGCRRQ